jgi:hypothetical protein
MLVGAAAAGARALLGSAMRCVLPLHLLDTLPNSHANSKDLNMADAKFWDRGSRIPGSRLTHQFH